MSFEKTNFFEKNESDFEEEIKEEIIDGKVKKKIPTHFLTFSVAGVPIDCVKDTNNFEINGTELKVTRLGELGSINFPYYICKTLDPNFKQSEGGLNSPFWNSLHSKIESVHISEFTGDFQSLLNHLDCFENLKSAKVDDMLCVTDFDLNPNHKTDYILEITNCSIHKLGLPKHKYPKIRIKNSLVSGIFSINNIIIENGLQEWVESKTDSKNKNFTEIVTIKVGKAFNEASIFNQVMGTKLKSLPVLANPEVNSTMRIAEVNFKPNNVFSEIPVSDTGRMAKVLNANKKLSVDISIHGCDCKFDNIKVNLQIVP